MPPLPPTFGDEAKFASAPPACFREFHADTASSGSRWAIDQDNAVGLLGLSI